jgi:hypothetical protein
VHADRDMTGVTDDDSVRESWILAERSIGLIGPFSPLFSASIRAVRCASQILQTEDAEKIRAFAIDAAFRPINLSPTFKAALWHYAHEVGLASQMSSSPPTSVRDFLQKFAADEIISVMATTYLYRLLRKRCDADEWQRLLPKMQVHMQLGALMGERLPQVGRGYGMLIAASRFLGQAIMLQRGLKPFKELRRKMESRRILFDLKEEMSRFGFTHLQVASGLVSALGFGVGPRRALGVGCDLPFSHSIQSVLAEESEEALYWRISLVCTESLQVTGLLPKLRGLNIDAEVANEIHSRTKVILSGGRGFRWFEKTKEEVPEEIREILRIPLASPHNSSSTSQASIG